MGIVLKELNETVIWLEVFAKAQLLPNAEIVAVISENRELCRILTAAVKSARAATNT
jgi:four helix bundle protein